MCVLQCTPAHNQRHNCTLVQMQRCPMAQGTGPEEEVYEVEAIVGARPNYQDDIWEYKIRWVGYGSDQDTWYVRIHVHMHV